jgi:hypothetical protein
MFESEQEEAVVRKISIQYRRAASMKRKKSKEKLFLCIVCGKFEQ